MVIYTTITRFDISHILIDGGSSCDIMYLELFEKMGLKKKNLWSYEGFDLQVFSNTMTRLWGYIKLMIYIGNKKNNKTVDLQFVVVPYKSIYNCILGSPFGETLDGVTCSIHLKLKFYNLYNEPITVNVDLVRSKRVF